jgi:hypothetical protein
MKKNCKFRLMRSTIKRSMNVDSNIYYKNYTYLYHYIIRNILKYVKVYQLFKMFNSTSSNYYSSSI